MPDVPQRVTSLEAAAAIDKVKMRHAAAVDAFLNGESGLEPVLVEIIPEYRFGSAVLEACTGADAYRDLLAQYAQRVDFSLQFLTGSVTGVNVQQGHAVGDWVVWHPFALEGAPWIMAGRSHDEFVQRGERWLLSATSLVVEVIAPWSTGWGTDRISPQWQGKQPSTISEGGK